MDRDQTTVPPAWVLDLADSDMELRRGERVPSTLVHAELDRALAELNADRQAEQSLPSVR